MSNSLTHTAAPWLTDDAMDESNLGIYAIIDSEGFTICNPSPMGKANATLISSAPVMFDALALIAEGQVMSIPFSHADTVRCYQEIARTAIAKAKGSEPPSTVLVAEKQFLGFWHMCTFGDTTHKVVGINDCADSNGYDPHETASIDELEIGQVWISSDYGTNHTITRIV